MRFQRNKKFKFVLLTSVILAMLAIMVAGCVGNTTPAAGWSGAAISDGNIYIGSLTGKLVGMAEDNGNRLFNDLPLEIGTTGGFLGCGASQIAVAIYGTPIVSGNQVFVAGYNGKVYYIDATKGLKGWSFQPERGLQPIISGLALNQGSLFFGTVSGYVYSINAVTSSQNWEFKTGGKIWATPLIDNGTLYIGSFDKKLYAVDTGNGKEKWHFDAGGAIVSTPVLQNNVLYFGTMDRYFYAVDATTGTLKWKSAEVAGNWFWANPILINNTIYAPNMDGKVYVFNAENGQKITDPLNAGSPISSSPVVFNNNIILASENGRIWTLDAGKNILSQLMDKSLGKVYASLSIDNGIIYIHTQDNMLYAVKADTGVVLWNKSLAG